jgi:hypothetical protein
LFAQALFGGIPLGVARTAAPCFSLLFLLAERLEVPALQGFLQIQGRRLAVFVENHPDIGQITARPVRS